jgi:hypothetical protein
MTLNVLSRAPYKIITLQKISKQLPPGKVRLPSDPHHVLEFHKDYCWIDTCSFHLVISIDALFMSGFWCCYTYFPVAFLMYVFLHLAKELNRSIHSTPTLLLIVKNKT